MLFRSTCCGCRYWTCFAITTDNNVRLQKLKANECQIALYPKPLDVGAAEKDPALKVEKTAAFMTAFVAINSQHPPLDKPEVRQAINLAFDKQTYLNTVHGEGNALIAINPYPPTMLGYNTSPSIAASAAPTLVAFESL